MSREHIAEVLKCLRKESGLSVQDVCDWLESKGHKVKVKTLYSYETGHRQPDADVLILMCELYAIDNVLTTFGSGQSANDAVRTEREKAQAHLCELVSRLNDEGIGKVIGYATDLASTGNYNKDASREKKK